MKILNLELPYKVVGEGDRKAMPKNSDVTRFLIQAIVGKKYEKDMPRTDSRIWAQLQDRTEDVEDLPLADSEFDWLYEIVKDSKLPPSLARWYWTFMDHMDNLKDKKEEQEAKEK